jgi:hypothetical protein
MPTDSSISISPDQACPDATARRELVNYYQEFFRWRRNQWAIAATNNPHRSQGSPDQGLKKTVPPSLPEDVRYLTAARHRNPFLNSQQQPNGDVGRALEGVRIRERRQFLVRLHPN